MSHPFRDELLRPPLASHIHIRPALARDMARLARVQSRTAIGLVLAGGGAGGCSHLGLYRALQESGTEVDFVGGTSIGAIMATLITSDQPWDRVMTIARKAFSVNPTGFPWQSSRARPDVIAHQWGGSFRSSTMRSRETSM